jgi:hypothetical protein
VKIAQVERLGLVDLENLSLKSWKAMARNVGEMLLIKIREYLVQIEYQILIKIVI